MYVDDYNIIFNTQDIDEEHNHLKTEFEMKDISKIKFCFSYNSSPFTLLIWYTILPISINSWRNSNMDKSFPSKL